MTHQKLNLITAVKLGLINWFEYFDEYKKIGEVMESKMIWNEKRVVYICTETSEISERKVATLADRQKLVGGLIECAMILDNGDEVYVNEEGLFSDPTYFFQITGGHQPFAGNAYVIGPVDDEGENGPAQSTLEEIANKIAFLGKGRME